MIEEILYSSKYTTEDIKTKKCIWFDKGSASINNKTYKKLEGECLRRSYYEITNTEIDDISIKRNDIKIDGNLYFKKMIIDNLKKRCIIVGDNILFEISRYNICGNVDCIISDNNENIGLIITTLSDNKHVINDIFGSKWNTPKPNWKQLFQALIACYAFKETVDKFILFYICRSDYSIKEFEVSIMPIGEKIYSIIDGKIDYRFCVNDILERLKMLSIFIKNKEVPPKEYLQIYNKEDLPKYEKLGILSKYQIDKYEQSPFGDIECSLCPYYKKCISDI